MRGMKITVKVIGWLINVLLVILLTCNIYTIGVRYFTGILQPTIFGWSWAVVVSGSMEPEISINDLIIVREKDDYVIDDVITFESGSSVVTHRIVGETPEGYSTQGDANNTVDSAAIPKENVIGKVIWTIPMVGLFIEYLRTPLGMTCMVLLGFLLVEIPYLMDKRHKGKGGRS